MEWGLPESTIALYDYGHDLVVIGFIICNDFYVIVVYEELQEIKWLEETLFDARPEYKLY